jgi:hypothetical protein
VFANVFLEERIFLYFLFENIEILRCRCVLLFRSALGKSAAFEAQTLASAGRKNFHARTALKCQIQRLDAENSQFEN